MFISPIAARTVLLSVMVLGGCGGGNNGNPPPGPDPHLILVAGEYATAVRLERNTCPGIVVQNNPTTVTHVAGASTLTISHAAIAYDGTLRPSGAFETSSRTVTAGTETHTISVAGSSSGRGSTRTRSWTSCVPIRRRVVNTTCGGPGRSRGRRTTSRGSEAERSTTARTQISIARPSGRALISSARVRSSRRKRCIEGGLQRPGLWAKPRQNSRTSPDRRPWSRPRDY
jgi:hypothetical protein